MCNMNCIIFGAINLSKQEISGKRVIEIGSCNVNGSLRPIIEGWQPLEYIGVDIEKGPGVDVVCRAEELVAYYSKDKFDVVITTELLEHIKDWRKAVSNIKNICKPNGIILITTRSIGSRYHGYPYDFWRYELEDMKEIFSDCEILVLEKDIEGNGTFVKVEKKDGFAEKDLSDYMLYSIISNKRVKKIPRRRDFLRPRLIPMILKEQLAKCIIKIGETTFKVFRL